MWSFPSLRFPFSLSEEGEDHEMLQHFQESTGLTISEDESCVFVEASVPGILLNQIEISFADGMLWIKAVKKEEEAEDKKIKFYRRAANCYTYHVAIPVDIDESNAPESVCKNGILHVTLVKKNPGKLKLEKKKEITYLC
jgi:HSP20 family molecular chaperone IbpA